MQKIQLDSEVERARELYLRAGLPLDNVPDEHIKQVMQQESDDFRDKALTSAEDAASIILEGVKENVGEFWWQRCRILGSGGESDPESAYELEFFRRLANRRMALNVGDGNAGD